MTPVGPGWLALVLKHGDVLKARVAFQINNPQRIGREHQLDLLVGQPRERPVVVGRLDNNFVRAHRAHAVVDAFRGAPQVAFNLVKRRQMRTHPDTPGICSGGQ